MSLQTVIVGAGHASGQLVASLKQKKYEGTIVLIGDEPYLPYQRPPLSKKFLSGEMPPERLYVKPPAFYEDDAVEVRLHTKATRIDRENSCVGLENGDSIPYNSLVLATGSRVRELSVPGADLGGIHYLRTIADVDAIRADLSENSKVVIVGAGYIGLEVAAVSQQLGCQVTVLEMADRAMNRVVSPQISAFYHDEHAKQGVDLRLNTGLTAFHGEGRVDRVETSTGEQIEADLVVIGVGILPNTELAESAGLEVNNGIIVDDHCQTADPLVYAIGDCTAHPNAIYGSTLRLESVHNALEQAKTAAANICGGDEAYSQVPWFWSDQYDLKLQIAGLSTGYDDVVIRGNPEDRSFSCLYLKDGVFIAIDSVNAPRDFMQSKNLIAMHCKIDKERLADTSITMKEMASV